MEQKNILLYDIKGMSLCNQFYLWWLAVISFGIRVYKDDARTRLRKLSPFQNKLANKNTAGKEKHLEAKVLV